FSVVEPHPAVPPSRINQANPRQIIRRMSRLLCVVRRVGDGASSWPTSGPPRGGPNGRSPSGRDEDLALVLGGHRVERYLGDAVGEEAHRAVTEQEVGPVAVETPEMALVAVRRRALGGTQADPVGGVRAADARLRVAQAAGPQDHIALAG